MAKATQIVLTFVVPGVFRERTFLWDLERVGRRAQSDDRSASVEIRLEVLHLLRREILES